jgi:hypothetical protein
MCVAAGGVVSFDATRLGSRPTPKAIASTITKNAAAASQPQVEFVPLVGS